MIDLKRYESLDWMSMRYEANHNSFDILEYGSDLSFREPITFTYSNN